MLSGAQGMCKPELCLQRNICSPGAVGGRGERARRRQGGPARGEPGKDVGEAPGRGRKSYSPGWWPFRMASRRNGRIPSKPSFSIRRTQ